MSLTPSNPRTFAATTGLGLKLTPSNSPYPRTPKSPKKTRCSYESELSLTRIIGTTVNSPTAFDSLSSQRTFAYTAGAAAVVVTLDSDLQYRQRFYRARPAATPSIANNNLPSYPPSTPTSSSHDSRNRAVALLRDSGTSYSPTTSTAQLDWSDSSAARTWASRERIKAATCLSISQDGRFLAVGETGYMPRVLIFSLWESSDRPVFIINEHTFGVRAVAFSPDGRYLASLGNVNDGFLYIWTINPRTGAARLHSSNKCTSFVRGMVWMGSSLITAGTRHVKVWRIEETALVSPFKQKGFQEGISTSILPPAGVRTLAGRNCLLGDLVDTTFTCLASISDHMAVVCSDKGDICLLDAQNGQKFSKIDRFGASISCIAVDFVPRLVRISGRHGSAKTLSFDDIQQAATLGTELPVDPVGCTVGTGSTTLCAMAFVDDLLVTLDSQHSIGILSKYELTQHKVSAPFTAHRDPVRGVRLLRQSNEADFFTWSSSGSILFWDLQGRAKRAMQVDLEQPEHGEEEPRNQCQIVRASKNAGTFVAGDKCGVLTVVSGSDGSCNFSFKAHTSEILDIDLHEDTNTLWVASCGRDRTVQLFRAGIGRICPGPVADDTQTLSAGLESSHGRDSGSGTSMNRPGSISSSIYGQEHERNSEILYSAWTLLQTMDEHTASVCSVLFCDNGQKLVSSSTDRTIQIRQILAREVNGQEVIAAVSIRVIALKASPMSMALSVGDHGDTIVVSMLDKNVATFEISTGKLLGSFRATDSEGADAVVMDALVIGRSNPVLGRPTILAGVSSTDKSVRIYDVENGTFLVREWGHTAAVTDVALLELGHLNRTALISTGSDGTIMIWDLSSRDSEALELLDPIRDNANQSPPKETISARLPLRRVLSKVELASFQRPSPLTTPTGRSSPPRQLRKKTSKYSMSTQSPKLTIPPVPSVPTSYIGENFVPPRRESPRTRSRSPASPRRVSRRTSLASLDLRGQTKSTGTTSEFGTLNMATEQVCRTLRAYRKKLASTESVKEEALRELDQELRLTAKALGEKTLKNKAVNETVLAGLLDDYSARLVSVFDEKLRMSMHAEVRIGAEGGRSKSDARRSSSQQE